MNNRENYLHQNTLLTAWFENRILCLPLVMLTQEEFERGVDSLGEPHRDVVVSAGPEWFQRYNYELSYNQVCTAFFSAAKSLGKLHIVEKSVLTP